jgi:DNA-binding CsgD family transcriptional regulator
MSMRSLRDRIELTEVRPQKANTPHVQQRSCSQENGARANAPTGLILLDGNGECIYINPTAQQVLCYPKPLTSNGEISRTVREQIQSRMLPLCQQSERGTFLSGRRTYIYRTLTLESGTAGTTKATAAVVLERNSRRNENLRKLCEQYKLTPREREALTLLAEGLTSKEMAQRMNISSHTVKGFVHLIMLKLGVTTRSGIVGKINCA